jgi:hypothetical protein
VDLRFFPALRRRQTSSKADRRSHTNIPAFRQIIRLVGAGRRPRHRPRPLPPGRLDPNWYRAASQFVRMEFLHILDGSDRLLFLFCLVVPFRRFRQLIPVVTALTVAHSITLITSAYNLALEAQWFPPMNPDPPVTRTVLIKEYSMSPTRPATHPPKHGELDGIQPGRIDRAS